MTGVGQHNSKLFNTAYVINLDREKSRWKHVTQQLQTHLPSINVTRISAIDGTDPLAKKVSDWETISTGLCKWFCTNSQISCALSHLKSWKQFLDSNLTNVLICEDDVYFRDTLEPLLDKVARQLPHDFDILYLGCNECDRDEEKHTWWGEMLHVVSNGKSSEQKIISENIYVPHIAFGLHCYLISRKGATKLVNILSQGLVSHVDYTINIHHHDLKLYAVHPKLAYQKCILGVSNIAKGKHPLLLNKILDDKVDADGTSWAYKFTVPTYSIGPYILNIWTLLICILAALIRNFINDNDSKANLTIVADAVLFLPGFITGNISANLVIDLLLFHLIVKMGK